MKIYRIMALLPLLFTLMTSSLGNANDHFFEEGISHYRNGIESKKDGKHNEAMQHFLQAEQSLREALSGDHDSRPKARAYLRMGISQFYVGKATPAVESLRLALNEPSQLDEAGQSEAYFYWGLTLLLPSPPVPYVEEQVRTKFAQALQRDAGLAFPVWLQQSRPDAYVWFEDERLKIRVSLSIKLSPSEPTNWKISINGNELNDIEHMDVLSWNGLLMPYEEGYEIKGTFEKDSYSDSTEKTITIEPSGHEICTLKILVPEVEHEPPYRAQPIGEEILLKFQIKGKAPENVTVHFKHTDGREDSISVEPNAGVGWTYQAVLPSQQTVGEAQYYIEAKYDGGSKIRGPDNSGQRYRLSIMDETPPDIKLVAPFDGAQFRVGYPIDIKAEVTDNSSVTKVGVRYAFSQSAGAILLPDEMVAMDYKAPSNKFVGRIPKQDSPGFITFQLTATDENDNTGNSESVQIAIVGPMAFHSVDVPESVRVHQEIPITATVKGYSSGQVTVHAHYAFSQSLTANPSLDEKVALDFETLSNEYVGLIPKQDLPGFMTFQLTATDENDNTDNSERVQIAIVDPMVIHSVEVPESVRVHQGIPITVTVKGDYSGQVTVHVHYAFSPSSDPKPLPFPDSTVTTVGKTSSDTYIGQIPEQQSKPGYIWYYVVATDSQGDGLRTEPIQTEPRFVKVIGQYNEGTGPGPELPFHEGVWASYARSTNLSESSVSILNWGRGDVLSLAYLREGKAHQTLGAQLDFSYQDPSMYDGSLLMRKVSNASATVRWGPALRNVPITFTILAGVAGYVSSDSDQFKARQTASEASSRLTHITPVLGASLKYYPLEEIAVDAAVSIKLLSDDAASNAESAFTTTHLHHYELVIRAYLNSNLNLRAGYGQWNLGDRQIDAVQIGLGFTF